VRRMEGGRVNTWSWLEELQIPKAERDVTHLPLSLHRARPSGLPAPRGTAECNPRHHEQAHHCSSGMATGGRGNEYLIIFIQGWNESAHQVRSQLGRQMRRHRLSILEQVVRRNTPRVRSRISQDIATKSGRCTTWRESSTSSGTHFTSASSSEPVLTGLR
jgi:hypothetical protein